MCMYGTTRNTVVAKLPATFSPKISTLFSQNYDFILEVLKKRKNST